MNRREEYDVGRNNPIGEILILNVSFEGQAGERAYSEFDVANLKETFSKLNFVVTEVVTNPKKKDLIIAVDRFAAKINETPVDVAAVAVMSHGDKEFVEGSDGKKLNIDKHILRKFSNKDCPGMKGKPKLFLIQSCRGRKEDGGAEYIMKDSAIQTSSLKKSKRPPNSLTDAIIAYATVPNFVSYRLQNYGSWFIGAFCKVLTENGESEIQEIFKLVVKEMDSKEIDHHTDDDGNLQISPEEAEELSSSASSSSSNENLEQETVNTDAKPFISEAPLPEITSESDGSLVQREPIMGTKQACEVTYRFWKKDLYLKTSNKWPSTCHIM